MLFWLLAFDIGGACSLFRRERMCVGILCVPVSIYLVLECIHRDVVNVEKSWLKEITKGNRKCVDKCHKHINITLTMMQKGGRVPAKNGNKCRNLLFWQF